MMEPVELIVYIDGTRRQGDCVEVARLKAEVERLRAERDAYRRQGRKWKALYYDPEGAPR